MLKFRVGFIRYNTFDYKNTFYCYHPQHHPQFNQEFTIMEKKRKEGKGVDLPLQSPILMHLCSLIAINNGSKFIDKMNNY